LTQSRIEQFEAFLKQDPNNSFARYVIAQEYSKLERFDEAVARYQELIQHDPEYVAAYHHGGKTLERTGDFDGARSLYENGITIAGRLGNHHARAELEEALSMLP